MPTKNQGQGSTTNSKEQKPRDVKYASDEGSGLGFWEGDLPATASAGRTTPLNDEVNRLRAEVEANPEFVGKWKVIGSYANDAAAGSSAKTLRRRFTEGDYEFRTAWIGSDPDTRRRGLFARYDASKPYGPPPDSLRGNGKGSSSEAAAATETAEATA